MSSPTRPKAKRRKVDKCEEKSEVDVLERICAKRDDIEWLRETFIPRDEVRKRWPNRILDGIPRKTWAYGLDEGLAPAVAHFEALRFYDDDGPWVARVGDFVEVHAPEGDNQGLHNDGRHKYIVQLLELFEDKAGERWYDGRWFYQNWDTVMRIRDKGGHAKPGGTESLPTDMNPKRLFLSSVVDNENYAHLNFLNVIYRKVEVVRLQPGQDLPGDNSPNAPFYWTMEHDRRFCTFIDSFTKPPPSLALYANQKEPRELKVLELYCGCGGLSFIDRRTDDVIIETKWAVDYEASMCAAFKANYPQAFVYHEGVDEFLALCKHFKRLSDHYPDSWEPPIESGDEMEEPVLKKGHHEVERIISVALKETARRGTEKQEKGQLVEAVTLENSSLRFLVKWKGYHLCNAKDEWVGEEDLGCEEKLADWVKRTRARKAIPLPGDVQVIMGGPPCQGVSGLNRHGKHTDVLNDPRNRQVLAFYDVIEFFQPSFVLMENVLDIFKKQDGTYAKYATARLVNMHYQSRVGIISAAEHGAPQGRWRAFIWGAKSGKEQLPAFPEPTHFATWQGSQIPRSGHGSIVGFITEEARANARKMTLLGDVLSDLPEISNFCSAEWSEYASEPKTPMQLWLRRPPPAGSPSAAERAAAADAYMDHRGAKRLREHHIAVGKDPVLGPLAVAMRYVCGKNPNKRVRNYKKARSIKKDFMKATLCATMTEIAEADRQDGTRMLEHFQQTMDLNQRAFFIRSGAHIIEENKKALTAKGTLRDHRGLVLNFDDYLRCCGVPKHKDANFRHMAGVIVHKDGTSCAGHTHAARDPVKGTCCAGGGTRDHAPRGTGKTCRVDHHDKNGWRGGGLKGCPAGTAIMSTGGLLCPRWAVTYKRGKSNGRQGCFGRIGPDEIQPTVVGRAEPHNLRLVHNTQDRVVTIRENARCQGFPDYFALAADLKGREHKSWVRSSNLAARYQQLGNAVCPLVANALGRCLALAARGKLPIGAHVVKMPDPEFEECMERAKKMGLRSYIEEHGVPADLKKMLDRQMKKSIAYYGLTVEWETPEQDAKEQDANVKGREVVMEEVDEDEDLEVV